VGGRHQPVQVAEGAEQRVDVAVVADVVAEVDHGRWVHRRQPEGVHTQPGQVIEPGQDARQVAHPVAVAVHE